ncbi:unnamed protein product [Lota lota]
MERLTRDESSQRHGTSGWWVGAGKVGASTVGSLMVNYSRTLEVISDGTAATVSPGSLLPEKSPVAIMSTLAGLEQVPVPRHCLVILSLRMAWAVRCLPPAAVFTVSSDLVDHLLVQLMLRLRPLNGEGYRQLDQQQLQTLTLQVNKLSSPMLWEIMEALLAHYQYVRPERTSTPTQDHLDDTSSLSSLSSLSSFSYLSFFSSFSSLSSIESDGSLSSFTSVSSLEEPLVTDAWGPVLSEFIQHLDGSSSLASSTTLGLTGNPFPLSTLPTGVTALVPWKTNGRNNLAASRASGRL